jgi:hypothetical protein
VKIPIFTLFSANFAKERRRYERRRGGHVVKKRSPKRPRVWGQARPRSAAKVRWKGRIATEDRWVRFIEKTKAEIRVGNASNQLIRYFSEDSCWKRNVYTFVLHNTDNAASTYSLKRYTEELILGRVGGRLPNTPTFESNPFHWVLSALAADNAWEVKRSKVFRYGRHLLYAREHQVPEQFLIGFLYQAGTPSEVERKAGRHATEAWRDTWISTLELARPRV